MLFAGFFSASLYYGLFSEFTFKEQGESLRWLFIHVPSSVFSVAIYIAVAGLCSGYLIWKNLSSFLFAKVLVYIGAVLTAVSIITGMLWGVKTWGAYWVWDARLTSTLIQLFIYISLLILINVYKDNIYDAAKFGSWFAIFTCINIPIVKYAPYIWNTHHQKNSLITSEGVKMADDIQQVLLISFLGLFLGSLYFLSIFVKRELNKITSK